MRVFARRERPHPGAQLSLFEAADGWRYCLWVTNLPATTRGWRGQCAYIDAAHRVHARVEDVIRTGKDTGLGHFPSHDYKINQAWLDASMIACILLSWLKLLALDGDLAKAEPKTLRYRVLHAAARLVRGGRRRTLKIAAAWPWAEEDHHRLAAHPGHPAPHLTSTEPIPPSKEGNPGARGTPGHPARQPGHRHTPGLKSTSRNRKTRPPAAAINPCERSGLTSPSSPSPPTPTNAKPTPAKSSNSARPCPAPTAAATARPSPPAKPA